MANSWVTGLFGKGTKRPNRRADSNRLHLEILEDRLTPTATLGSSSMVQGPTAGSSSVVLADTATWTAKSNSSFLHIATGSTSGSGNALVQYCFDANTGATRVGTLTIAGQTFTVTQAGNTYVLANPFTTLFGSEEYDPTSVAVDSAGNVYFSDAENSVLDEYNASTQQITTLVSSGFSEPDGVALDTVGNVYIADTGNNAIEEYNPTTQQLTTLVSGLNQPNGVAVDSDGNVYFADTGNSAIKEYNVTTNQVTTLVSSGLSEPDGVAVDAAGNVYFADADNNAVYEYNVSTQQVATLVSNGLSYPAGIAVDGAGNVYIADTGNNAVEEYNATTQQFTTLVSDEVYAPQGVAVDPAGNLYIADSGNDAIETLTRAFVSAAPLTEPGGAGSDSLMPVLPTTQPLTGLYAPSCEAEWLTLGTASNGVIPFSFTALTYPSPRSAQIYVLGMDITVTQVPQVTPVVTVNPLNIVYGTVLDNSQLTGTATYNSADQQQGGGQTVPGTFTFTNAAGVLLNAGNGQIEQVTFTPTDTTDYSTVQTTTIVNVAQAIPVVTVNPVNLGTATTLDNSQLSGTATFDGVTVPGIFTYNNPGSSNLVAGTSQTEPVTFTPNDRTNYTTVQTTATVSTPILGNITVFPPPPLPSPTIGGGGTQHHQGSTSDYFTENPPPPQVNIQAAGKLSVAFVSFGSGVSDSGPVLIAVMPNLGDPVEVRLDPLPPTTLKLSNTEGSSDGSSVERLFNDFFSPDRQEEDSFGQPLQDPSSTNEPPPMGKTLQFLDEAPSEMETETDTSEAVDVMLYSDGTED